MRCSFTRTIIDFGMAQVSRTTSDGTAVPDHWKGEDEASVALERYAARYARAIVAEDEDGPAVKSETRVKS